MEATEPERSFPESLRVGDRARVAAFPKGERHCHSILAASLGSVAAWAGAPIEAPPSRMEGLPGMSAYARRCLYPHIRNRRGFEFTAVTAVREAVADGVTVLEMSLDADLAALYESGAAGFIAFARRLAEEARPDIDFRPEIGLSRRADPRPQIAVAEECISSGSFGSIDLYGLEDAQEPQRYGEVFRRARSAGMKLKAHVGEFCGPELVEETWRLLDLDEIQHGIAVARSAGLMDDLRGAGVRLNVCPGSNVALMVADTLPRHPIRAMVRAGLRVTINSDDKTVFHRSVSEEYLALFQAGTLGVDELEEIRRESLRD